MKILYTIENIREKNNIIKTLEGMSWIIDRVEDREQVLLSCSTQFYDVLVFDSTLSKFECLGTIKEIRDRQIFTPILVIAPGPNHEDRVFGLDEGADMCICLPFPIKELILKVRTLKRRNTNYQSPIIEFEGLCLHRPDGKITFGETSLSVNPIEIELFRLLTRASSYMSFNMLSEKIKEPEEKVLFFAQCLQKKIKLLHCPMKLEIKESKCRLVQKDG